MEKKVRLSPENAQGNEYEQRDRALTKRDFVVLKRRTDELDGVTVTLETLIQQNAQQILLRATKVEVGEIEGRVTTNEASISVMAGEILLKATQSDLDTLSGRVTTAEASILVQAGQIALKANQTTVDGITNDLSVLDSNLNGLSLELGTLEGRVSSAEASLIVQAGQIASKVSQSTFDSQVITTNTAISTAESNSKTYADGVASTAETQAKAYADTKAQEAQSASESYALAQAELAEIEAKAYADGIVTAEEQARINDAIAKLNEAKSYAELKAQEAENASKAYADTKAQEAENNAKGYTDSALVPIDVRLSSAESSIIQNSTDITLKVSSTDFNAQMLTKEGVIYKQSTAPAHLEGRLWLNTSATPNVLNRSNGSSWVKATPTSASEVGAFSEIAGNSLSARVTTAESSISVLTTEISLKASLTELTSGVNEAKSYSDTKASESVSTANGYTNSQLAPVLLRLDEAELKITPTAITSTVRSSTEYTSDLGGKENTIFKQTTAPTHLNGRFWLNTSVTPNILYRSNGTAWIKATPTEASEVGAYSSGQVDNILTSYSTITQTADKVALEIGNLQIGGANLIRNSGFEDGGLHWSPTHAGDTTYANTDNAPSRRYVRIVGSLNTTKVVRQDVPYTGIYDPRSSKFTFSGYFLNQHTTQGTVNPFVGVQIIVRYTDATVSYHTFNVATYYNTWTRRYIYLNTVSGKTINYMTVELIVRDVSSGAFIASSLKLEEGEKATAWSRHASEMRVANYIFDGQYATFKNGGLRIQNNAGTTVFDADTNGNLRITGQITATSGSFTGTINASSGSFTGTVNSTSGSIGGWSIGNNSLYNGNMYIHATNQRIYFNGLSGNRDLYYDGTYITASNAFRAIGTIRASGAVAPWTDNSVSCGIAGTRWTSVWAVTSTIQTSDIRTKTDIEPIQNGVDFVLSLEPRQYKLIDGQSGRKHFGFIAQEVEQVIKTTGIEDVAIYVDPEVNPSKEDIEGMTEETVLYKGLRYEEFIAPMVQTIQYLNRKIERLEAIINERAL